MSTPFKMKGFSGFENSPAKQKSHPAGTGFQNLKNSPKTKSKSNWNLSGWLKGEQGLVPDYKGKSTKKTVTQVKKRVKKAANESTFTNPRSASEVLSDQTDTRMHTRLMKEQFARDDSGEKTSKADAAYLKHYSDKNEKTRPNKKDRY
jgi:hypothetical protein